MLAWHRSGRRWLCGLSWHFTSYGPSSGRARNDLRFLGLSLCGSGDWTLGTKTSLAASLGIPADGSTGPETPFCCSLLVSSTLWDVEGDEDFLELFLFMAHVWSFITHDGVLFYPVHWLAA